MAIRNYRPFRNEIKISEHSDDTVTLRAVNFQDISRIFQIYEDQLEEVFVKLLNPAGAIDPAGLFDDIFGTIRTVVVVAPGVISELILISAEEDDDAEARVAVQMMSVEEQTRLIAEIVRLSATSEGGLGKLMDVAAKAVAAFAAAATSKKAATPAPTASAGSRAAKLGLTANGD